MRESDDAFAAWPKTVADVRYLLATPKHRKTVAQMTRLSGPSPNQALKDLVFIDSFSTILSVCLE